MKKTFSLLFLLLSFSQAAFASDESASVKRVCTELMQQKQTITHNKTSRFALLFKLIFERSSLIAPEEATPAPKESSSPTELPAPTAEIQNMTVFTLGHPEIVTDADKAQLKAIQEASTNLAKSLQKLLKTNSVAACVSEADKLNWSPQALTDLQNLQTAALEAYRHQESEASETVAAKVKKEHPSWNIVPVDSWGEITQNLRQNLKTSSPSGIMMILHASPSGRLFDSLRDELPTPFFKALPPNVKFVGVFSCDSGQVEKAYSLNDASQGREFVTVKLGSPFDKSESTPVQLFPTWVSKVSHQKLDETLDETGTPSAPAEQLCSVQMDSLKLLKGRLSLSISNFPVGVWTADNQDQSQLFPCSWLGAAGSDHSKLIAFVQPSSLDNPVELANTDFSVKVVTDLSHNSLPVISSQGKEIFVTEDGHFRSAVFHF